jgi:hypothetical protein
LVPINFVNFCKKLAMRNRAVSGSLADEMKPGFPHHGRFTSESARKMLSMRGGRAAAKTHRENGWKHQKRIGAVGRLTRVRKALTKRLAMLEAKWVEVYGETLFEHLLLREHNVKPK